jgi:molybdenum cofactor biosynthesis enzyme MoaA
MKPIARIDSQRRVARALRISVADRCNLRRARGLPAGRGMSAIGE